MLEEKLLQELKSEQLENSKRAGIKAAKAEGLTSANDIENYANGWCDGYNFGLDNMLKHMSSDDMLKLVSKITDHE